jgi:hypothetical protein
MNPLSVELQDGVDADFQTRWGMEVLCLPTASSRWYSWLRSSPSTATCAPLEREPAKSASLPKATHRMPLGARLPGSGIVLPGRLGGEREDRDVGCVGGLSFGVAANKTNKGDSRTLRNWRAPVWKSPDSRSGSCKSVVRKLGRPGILSKDHATTRCIGE